MRTHGMPFLLAAGHEFRSRLKQISCLPSKWCPVPFSHEAIGHLAPTTCDPRRMAGDGLVMAAESTPGGPARSFPPLMSIRDAQLPRQSIPGLPIMSAGLGFTL